ncbi:glucoamylase [Entomortierella parvispora]|uniref:glucan 1,4-alpha-glucosidase n=1 Tax=Entomortierella parvispora TaxID=205924 RepID=A0A9P3H1Q3_9FUNG|nr:glucoamylase [Entomortierella parvispora]
MRSFLLISAAIVLAQASPILFERATCSDLPSDSRLDCGSIGSTESTCTASSCCWTPVYDGGAWCYYTSPSNSTRPAAPDRNTIATWLNNQYSYSVTQLLNALAPPGAVAGAVVAAQSTSNPDYWYHWARDSSLTMDTIARLYANAIASGDTTNADLYLSKLQAWITFEAGLASRTNPTVNITGNILDNVGEPKFNVDGSAFTGSWGRPQNDGPGLRVRAIKRFLDAYVAATGDTAYATSLSSQLQRDLDYIVRNYANACITGTTCFDLWEEKSAQHWYTEIVQRRGLIAGKDYFSSWVSNSSLVSSYENTASALEGMMADHWNSTAGYINQMMNISGRKSPDAAILLGSIHSFDTDNYNSPTNDQVMLTVWRYARFFKGQFAINQQRSAYAPTVGRYMEDVYNGDDGVNNNGAGAWLLATAGMAEFYYDAATSLFTAGSASVTSNNQQVYEYFGVSASVGGTISGSDLNTLVNNLFGEADAYLDTLSYWMGSDQMMTEQFNPVSGVRQGAHHLTWSYAALITAKFARDTALSTLAGTPTPPITDSCNVAVANRTDCGYVGITQAECQSTTCCWSPLPSGTAGPWCFYAASS